MKDFKNDIVKIIFEYPVIECNVNEEYSKMTIDLKDIDLNNVGVVNFKIE